MKKSRFTDEQIIKVMREQEAGARTEDVCRRHGISTGTLYKWKSKFGGLEVSDAKRLRSLEDENPEAEEAAGGVDAGQRGAEGSAGKRLTTPRARRAAAEKLMARSGMSQRRAARLVGCDPAVSPIGATITSANGCAITRPSVAGSATGVSG